MAVGVRIGDFLLVAALVGCGDGTIDLFAEDGTGPRIGDATLQGEAAADRSLATPDLDGENADSGAVFEAEARAPSPRDAASEMREAGARPFGDSCLSNADCTSADSPRCEPTQRVCVQCIGAAGDCANQRASVCNRITNTCELPCAADSDCSPPDVCDFTQGACADCLENSQCPSSAPYCVSEECVECTTSSDCRNNEVCWHQRCVACVTNANCPDGGTCTTSHECI